MKAKFVLALLASTLVLPVLAQTATPRLDQREANQEKRIDQGVASGALTTREANTLERREDRLKANEAAAKADGKVTRAERVSLEAEANRNSRVIHNKKTNLRHDFNHNGVTDHPRR